MGIIKDRKKFERKVKQKYPTNPGGNTSIETNKVDFDAETIRKQKNKS